MDCTFDLFTSHPFALMTDHAAAAQVRDVKEDNQEDIKEEHISIQDSGKEEDEEDTDNINNDSVTKIYCRKIKKPSTPSKPVNNVKASTSSKKNMFINLDDDDDDDDIIEAWAALAECLSGVKTTHSNSRIPGRGHGAPQHPSGHPILHGIR
jgi:hypothetical protein